MRAKQYLNQPFQGWNYLRDVFAAVGPGFVLQMLTAAAWRQTKSADNSYRFVGDEVHHHKNHGVACRAALRMWLDQGCPPVTVKADPATMSLVTEVLVGLSSVAHQAHIDAPGRQHPGGGRRRRVRRAAMASWVAALQDRCRNRNAYSEMGRIWRAFRAGWDEAARPTRTADATPLRPPLSSAFDSLEAQVRLALMVFIDNGWLADPVQKFSKTKLASQIAAVVEAHVPAAADVVGSWEDIEREVGGMRNTFAEAPMVRLPTGAVVAPDPGFLMPGLEELVVRRISDNYAAEAKETGTAGRTALGHTFEGAVAALVEECGEDSIDERFVAEFPLARKGRRSPDAHLVAPDEIVLFEAKAGRLPEPPDGIATLNGLIERLRHATGERKTGNEPRAPLEQATRFIAAWANGDRAACDQLGALPTSALYVLVVPYDLPACVHWPAWREQDWRPLLGSAEAELDRRTVFLSFQDLETTACVLAAQKRAGTPTSFRRLVQEWLDDWRGGDLIRRDESLRGGLGDFLLSNYQIGGCAARCLRAAADEMFETLAAELFSAEEIAAGHLRRASRRDDAPGQP
jgi:hypothetical protein